MCVSTPKVTAPSVTAPPVQSVEQEAVSNTIAARESDLRRRRRALSRLSTMEGGAMQGSEAGKTRLGM